MGKSKFPGKPSRLVNKKRVSVLSPAGLTLSDEDNQENGGQQQAATLGNSSAAAVAAATAAGTSPASAAASATVSMRTTASEKAAFPAQRKEQQHTKASKSSGNNGNSSTGTIGSSSQPLETANGRRNGSDKAAISKNGASENDAEKDSDDNDDRNDENEDDNEEDDEEEEDDEDDDDEEEDDEDDDDDDDEEENSEEVPAGGRGGMVGVVDDSTTSSSFTTPAPSSTVSSMAATTSTPAATISGTCEVRSSIGNGQQQSSQQEQQQQTMQSSSSGARSEKQPVTGNGFEMKPSTLTSALARRCPPGVASGRVSRQQSPSCEQSVTDSSSDSIGSSNPSATGTTTTTRVPKVDASPEQSSTAGDGTGSSESKASALMGSKPPPAAASTSAAASTVGSITPAKKKSVTFHTTLETTDENMVKKVYNPDTVPLPSIIKKECLARPIRLKKSFNRKMKKRLQRAVAAAAAAAAASTAASLAAGGASGSAKSTECLVRPSRLTEIMLKSSNKSSTGGSAATSLDRNGSSGSVGGLGFGLKSLESVKSGLAFGTASSEPGAQVVASSTEAGSDAVGRNLESGGTQFGDKRFILPKRSVHSSRVIKPNKRFLDEFELEIKKKNKNLAAAAAVAAAAAAAESGSATGTGSILTASSDSTTLDSAGTSIPDGNEADSATGEETRKKKDKKRSDESTDKSTSIAQHLNDQRPEGNQAGDRSPMTPISINPFAKTSLTEGPLVAASAKCSSSKLVKPSQLSPAIPGASSTLGSATTNTTNLSAAASIFGKGILRQPRLQFATSLLNSNSTGNVCGLNGPLSTSITSTNSNAQTTAPLSGTHSAGSVVATANSGASSAGVTLGTSNSASEGLFTMHLKAKAKLDASKLFTAALSAANSASPATQSGTSSSNAVGPACCICNIPVNSRYYAQPTKKYGVSCCDVCRKFISKMVKKLATGSLVSPNHHTATGAEVTMLKCRNEGKCLIIPPSQLMRPEAIKTRHIFKERCHACWLRKCLGNFQLPPVLKIRLGQTLPLTMRTFEPSVSGSSGSNSSNASLKKELVSEGNLFANSIAEHGPTNGTSRILWNSGDKKPGGLSDSFNKTFNPFLALHINPLSQNNNTFGSVPQIKLSLSGNERSNIMAASPSSSSGASSSDRKSPLNGKEDIFAPIEPRKEKETPKVEDTSTEATSKKDEQENSPIKPPRTRSKSEATSSQVVEPPTPGTVEQKPESTVSGALPSSASSTPQPAASTAAGPLTTTGANQAAATDKRQRIDLKGPRVKHVCRSASIVLGQPLATFPEDGTADAPSGEVASIETPPSDSAAEPAEDLPFMDRERHATVKQDCSDCIDPTVALSPPATPDETTGDVREALTKSETVSFDPDTSGSTEKELVIDEDQLPDLEDVKEYQSEATKAHDSNAQVLEPGVCSTVMDTVVAPVKEAENVKTTFAVTVPTTNSTTTVAKKFEEIIEKPTTRKTTGSFRPQASRPFGIGAASKHGPFNISGRKQQQSQVSSSLVSLANRNSASSALSGAAGKLGAGLNASSEIPMISIDFWENYDPAEVSRAGFGLILSESMPVRALCFLCGSAGLESMLFCVCCCEPYHQYCVKDEYNLRTGTGTGLDDTGNMSLLDVTLGASPQQQQQQLLIGRFNWMCPRCTVCYSCNMATGVKVKCQKCAKHYHTTCLGTSKRLHGADRPLICASCLRCKSCGTTNVTKFIGNLPMCTPCFRLRQKGNYCPLCQKCYEDNDFDLKMMECGDCRRWVHARCEGLTDEQYNMLSVLPENIEFICKKCTKHSDSTAHLWRDAVAAEFKAGLLSVVKLLSKSRQACALLKLSPRKKSPNCTCDAVASSITNGKNISFFSGAITGGDPLGFSSYSKKPKLDEDSIYDFNSENSCGSSSGNSNAGMGYAVVPIPGSSISKCYCSARATTGKGLPAGGDISLVDIKQKINANEYYSLQDFHYDMNTLLQAVCSEELTVAYKEFLSETFPWFQNETKACTDALEEAMCGEVDQSASLDRYHTSTRAGALGGDRGGLAGSHSSTNHSIRSTLHPIAAALDQKVPQIDIPLDELSDYFHGTEEELLDIRICMLCKQQGEGMPLHESRLLYCGQNNWIHTNCALWSAEVFEEIDGSLQNVHSAVSRGRLIKCCHCGVKGATVGCNVKNCGEHYHFPCARRIGCIFMLDKTVYCTSHAVEAQKKRCPEERNFEIARSVYVELDRRKKRFVDPARVQFMIGSLNVRRLGHIVPTFSDQADVLIPTDFECTRLYWSAKEPWKIVSYRIKTSIQSSNYCYGTDLGKNFTVDHSSNSSSVQWGLNQIARWHTSLHYCEDQVEEMVDPLDNEALQQHLLSSMSSTATTMTTTTTTQLLASSRCEQNTVCGGTGDDTNDEEPQNTNDLLPPEIKDAIFEDLPHDILDGISMLDILPKLMTYEDLLAMDLKTDATFNIDILKDPGILQGLGNVAGTSSGSSTTATNIGHTAKTDDHTGMDVDDMESLHEAIGGAVGSELSNDIWAKTIGAPGIEDALLSGLAKPTTTNVSNNIVPQRELKRSKSDILEAIAAVGQQQPKGQRSGSFSWNTKQLESTAAVVAKRRKIAKNNIKLSDVLSLGRIKEDTQSACGLITTAVTTTTTMTTATAASTTVVLDERHKTLQEDFSWATVKKSTGGLEGAPENGENVFEKLKISQLDGVDDICLDGTVSEMKIYSSRSMIEAPVKCDRCQATYRNQESYQRHLSSCEVLSTSESESETRSPRLLSPEQQQQQQQQQQQIITGQIAGTAGSTFILPQATSQPQTITTDIYGNTTGYLTTGSTQSAGHPQTISVLQAGQTINLNGNQAILSNLPTSMPITINQLSSGGIPIQTSGTGPQQIPLQGTLQAGLQNLGGNMIISTGPNGQGQLFTTNQFSNAAFQQQAPQQQAQQQVLQDTNSQQFVQNKQRFIQPAPTTSSISLPHSLASGTGPMTTTTLSTAQALGSVFSQQPQIISIGPNGQPQLMTIAAPQHQQTILQAGVTQPMAMQQGAKKIVYTTASPKKVMTKLSHPQQHPQQQGLKSKRTLASNGMSKPGIQIKTKQQQQQEQTMTLHPTTTLIGGQPTAGQLQTTLTAAPQQQQQQQQIQLINTSYPLIQRATAPTAPHQTSGNVIFQTQPTTNQPILVQQVGGNQISYLADQGTLTATHNPVQYQLAPANVLTQNGFAMATTGADAGTLAAATANNILIPNGTGGYSLIPAGALQIATQPQVIGTIVQPQAAAIQCGMMATEQMVLGATAAASATAQPTLEMMVTDPTSGCMYLTSPSMYYGLETIVQNTVMSSQQFVSATAMQGVLSQNSSFSATTTQVFAASKIEPIVEMPTGYVVLNNDGTTAQQMQIGTSTASVVSQAPAPVQIQTSTSVGGNSGQGIFQQAQLQPTAAVVSSSAGSLPATLQTTPIGSIQQQQQQQQLWKLECSTPSAISIQPNTVVTSSSNSSTSIVTPLKPTMKTIIPKSQPQLVNKVMPNTAMKVLSAGSEQTSTSNGSTASQQQKSACFQSIVSSSVYTTATALTTSTKVSNVIKPITKTTNYTKPKIVAKPVKQKVSPALLSPPTHTPMYQLQQQQPQTVMISTQPVQQQQQQQQQQLLQNSITLIPATSTTAPVNNSSQLVPIKPNVSANGLQTITANQLTVSAIPQQPAMVIEKLPHQMQPVTSSTSVTPVTNGISLSNGQMMIIQPNGATLGKKPPTHVTGGTGLVKKQKTMLPMNQTQMISYTTPQQLPQQQQQQQQQPYQQLISVASTPQQLSGISQQQLQQQQQIQSQPISIAQGVKGPLSKKSSSNVGQITLSLANIGTANTIGPVPVSMPASTITITPSQPASITLPTAPYPMPLYSSIPTNVVNPIQQQTNQNTISSTANSRPTNRVLPMQASVMQQKNPEVSQTPPPPPLKMLHQQCSEKLDHEFSIIPSPSPFGVSTPSSSPNDVDRMKMAGNEKLLTADKNTNRLEIEIKPIEITPLTSAMMTPTTTNGSCTPSPLPLSSMTQQHEETPQQPELPLEQATMMMEIEERQQQEHQQHSTEQHMNETPSFQFSLSFDGTGGTLIPLDTQQSMTAQIEIKPILPSSPTGTIDEMQPTLMSHDSVGDDRDTETQRIDELKHSLEAETQEMLAEGHETSMCGDSVAAGGSSGATSPSLNDGESDSPEIKDKISEILDNLEQQTNQEVEMQMNAFESLGGSKEHCSDETERLVAELREEFHTAASSPSLSTTGSTVPLMSVEQAQATANLAVQQTLLTISDAMFDNHSKKASNITGCYRDNIDRPNFAGNAPGDDLNSLLNDGDTESVLFGKIRQPEPSPLSQPSPTEHHHQLHQLDEELQQFTVQPLPPPPTNVPKPPPRSTSPKLLYEIQSQDGFTYKSTSIAEIWDKLFEAVQTARRAHGLMALPEGQLKEMAGVQMLGLKTNAIRYLLEQLPGVEKCTQYNPLYHQKQPGGLGGGLGVGEAGAGVVGYNGMADYFDELQENAHGTARCEPYKTRSEYDMFSWLASRHRKQPMPIVAQSIDDTIIPRRGSGSNLPMAMRYRTLKESSKESVGVYRSHIHGRGLFCNRDIEAGEMVIEYAGELIRSTLTDKRERYYDSRGIGCYMFKIDENFVVDATMRGNAARFINHSCEPNCYSKVVDILGHKHIIIFALRRIVQGEELTYDYKFPFEDVKIPCSCGSKKCRKYLN